MYLVADQVLKHFDKNTAPPDLLVLVQRLRLWERLGKRKIDLAAALKMAKAIFSEDIVGQKATLTEWVIEFGKIEQTKIAFRRGVELLKEGKYDDIEETMGQLFDFFRIGDFEDADGAFVEDSMKADIAQRRLRAKDRVPTGKVEIDKYLGGGLGLGQLYVIAGGTGVGKTTAALEFCRGAVHAGEPSLLISTEVQRPRLMDKYHAAVTGIPTGIAQIADEARLQRKMAAYLETRQKLFHVVWFEPYTKTMADVREYIKYLRDRYNFNPKLIAFDSPDLLKPSERHMKPHEGLAEIYTSIFALTGKDNVATLVTTDVKQASRDNLLIGVTDIGGSYEKAKKADGVFGIGRDKKAPLGDNGGFVVYLNFDKLRTDGTSGLVLEIEVAPHMSKWGAVNTLTPEKLRELMGSGPKEGGKGGGPKKAKQEFR